MKTLCFLTYDSTLKVNKISTSRELRERSYRPFFEDSSGGMRGLGDMPPSFLQDFLACPDLRKKFEGMGKKTDLVFCYFILLLFIMYQYCSDFRVINRVLQNDKRTFSWSEMGVTQGAWYLKGHDPISSKEY